ncbi:MAG: efflux RND transporter permease subunit [Deltaproteobacteria bacterium]|nr:efflux RND transporter permease subunit [Deltaproteobacteria bacterium]
MTAPPRPTRGLTAQVVEVFITSKLSILFLIASLLAGALALLVTAREEEPQIVVPFADVFVQFPGASAQETEKLVATPLEQKLWEIDGVEYVYSMSRPGEAVATVRFYVGEDRERSLVKVWNKVMSNQDAVPPGVTSWIVKPVEIDDVAIVLFTLSAAGSGGGDLRRVADEVLDKLTRVPNTGRSWVVGGQRRQVTVYADPVKLAARGLSLLEVVRALGAANLNVQAGSFERGGREVLLEAGPFFGSADEVANSVLAAPAGHPVYVRDVARVIDGPEEVQSYSRIGFGPAAAQARVVGQPHGELAPAQLHDSSAPRPGEERPAVTIAVAKRKGTNAVRVAEEVIREVEALRGSVIPDDVAVHITRDYGETANHKVNELVKHLLIAIATIIVLLALALGPKEAFIVALAVPMTLAITLLLDLIFGYTINRVTLFALILSLGLLVDDPIVDVENIFRHFKLRQEPPLEATLTAVDEVRPPTILATFTVIVSFLPMFFITGMMGPYMAPMAFNVPVAMLTSLVVAFTVTPWASYHLLKGEYGKGGAAPFAITQSAAYRWYRAVLAPLLARPRRAALFLLAVVLAFAGSALLAVTRAVPLKMLPFDNKNELALVIDMPRGTALEDTDAVTRALGAYLATVAEVTDYESYVGLASPMDFNGMVRHYYLRRGGHVADMRINLLPKEARTQQSHEIALRLRPEVERIGRSYGANVKIVEAPPGPPVLATVVAEVYGPLSASNDDLVAVSKRVRHALEQIDGVVDVDDYAEAEHSKMHYRLDRDKAALTGVSVETAARTLQIALAGSPVGRVHVPEERLPLALALRVPRAQRSAAADLLALQVQSSAGALVALGEIGSVAEESGERTIYHKNLRPVAFVIAEMAGRSPVEAVFDLQRWQSQHPLPAGYSLDLAGEGEWKITVDVFRDLGLAFGAALLMIYVLLVAQTQSLLIPVVIMIAIPLTVIGIMPGFWVLNLLFTEPVGAYATPVFFTATGMIGMIALAGIVVRNSIILIDFIEHIRSRGDGRSLAEAVIEAGATRLRPIVLTAGAAMSGSVVITLDPIFSGLAWSFIFGIFASTAFSLVVVPLVYFLLHRQHAAA